MTSATQSLQHALFTAEPLVKLARSAGAAIRSAFRHWAAAQERAAWNRLARELSARDWRVMEQISAIRDR